MSMLSKQILILKDEALFLEQEDERRLANILRQAADTIEALSAKLAKANMERSERYYSGGWIAAEDRLPDTMNNILLCTKKGYITVGRCFQGNYFYDVAEGTINSVLAWMPLPEPYKQDVEVSECC